MQVGIKQWRIELETDFMWASAQGKVEESQALEDLHKEITAIQSNLATWSRRKTKEELRRNFTFFTAASVLIYELYLTGIQNQGKKIMMTELIKETRKRLRYDAELPEIQMFSAAFVKKFEALDVQASGRLARDIQRLCRWMLSIMIKRSGESSLTRAIYHSKMTSDNPR
ncbi:hypothetical protein HY213_03285 [Candidatus Peregrinibacteria bacterium]|nr:hypothetical protein [Candidatus Peregrinibacteria bacterium]